MTQKSQPRRGLGRGLGSLIPTSPRPEEASAAQPETETPAATTVPPQPTNGSEPVDRAGTGSPDTGVDTAADPENSQVNGQIDGSTPSTGAGTADWIGVPLPGDVDRPAAPLDTDGKAEDAVVDRAAAPTAGDDLQPVAGARFAEIPVDHIAPNARQPREVFDEDAMAELVHSIREIGLLQPVVVRPVGEDRFELIMGERRWRASQQAGLTTIPAIVRETGDDAMLRDALLENLHRAELNALEEAAAYQQLLDDFGCTHDELATRIGRSRPQISNTLRLLKLSPAVQRRVAAGVLSAGHARTLLAIDDAAVQDRLAGRVVSEGISVRGLEEIVAVGDLGSAEAKPVRRSRPTSPGLDDLAARLSDHLETRVKVDLGKRKGRITVEFASLPDLERIVGVIDPAHTGRIHRQSD
jgi:ParB family transcriptional regulator, chromosome partitioning protein